MDHNPAMIAFIHALILAFAFEGIAFALFPKALRRAMLEAASLPDATLRTLGCGALASAIILAFALRLLR